MQYLVSIHGYDCLDHVKYTAAVRQYGDYEETQGETVLIQAGSFRGEGIDDAREWLGDLLVHLLESL